MPMNSGVTAPVPVGLQSVSSDADSAAHSGPPESIDAVLAKNLLVARIVAGATQQRLAQAANISRATIAQLETGYSDPRLSTIVELASALGIPAFLLLIGQNEVQPLTEFAYALESDRIALNEHDLARMRKLVASGMLKDRVRAAKVGALSAGVSDEHPAVSVSTSIFSAMYPGPGTLAGRLLGRLLSKRRAPPARAIAADSSPTARTAR